MNLSVASVAQADSEQAVQGFEPRTISDGIRLHAELRPEQPAIVASGFAALSYRELRHRIDAISTVLRRAGFDRNARIVVALENDPEAALAIVAVACAAVAVPLDPKLALPEVERRLVLLRPNAVLILRDSSCAARTVAEHRDLTIIEAIVAGAGKLDLRLAVPQVGPALPLGDPDPDAPAFILQTSGTTADPKLVPFSHRNMLAAKERLQTWFALTPRDRCLSVTPVCYTHGLEVSVLAPLLTGGSVAFPASASKVDLSEWLGALSPTWYSATPTLHLTVLEKARSLPDARTMHSLRFVSSAAAPLPRDVHEGFPAVLGVPVLQHYGSSEAAQIACDHFPPGPSKYGTCGVPWPGTVAVVGEDGHHLPPGEQGEILVRGGTVMSGYLDAPELNRLSFVDGWLRTGDIGSLDAEGFLTLHGRLKDVINRGGEKIAPLEIDSALLRHPAVAEAAAYAVPHPRLGEDIAAAVVLHPGCTVDPSELREFLGTQLAASKIPRRIVVLDQLPKGAYDKVLRRRLSENSAARAEQSAKAEARWHAELLHLWNKLLKTSNLTIDDDFFEKGGDSLLALDLHAEIERLAGAAIPESILYEASTVRGLAKQLAPPPPLGFDPVVHGAASKSPLLFFVDEGASTSSLVRDLTDGLEPEQPLIVISAGVISDTSLRSIEGAAADRLSLILKTQPEGSFRLGGHGKGALVAFETARLLVAGGKKVKVVAMVDPATIATRSSIRMFLSALSWPRRSTYFPTPLAVPIVIFSRDYDERAWRRISPDVEVIKLSSQHDGWVKTHSATLVSYLRARLQSIHDPTFDVQ